MPAAIGPSARGKPQSSYRGSTPSQGRRLLAALRDMYANRDEMLSEEIVKLLAADPTAEWCESAVILPAATRSTP